MIIKVGSKFYNSHKEPIAICFSEEDIEEISNLIDADENCICAHPADAELEAINEFIDDFKSRIEGML